MTVPASPERLCVHEFVADWAAKAPDSAVVVAGDRVWTYRELNDRANQLAHTLRRLGVQPDTVVGLCMERSFAMVVGSLAILKAGAAYLPVDLGYPSARLSHILNDAKVPIVVTGQCILEQMPPGAYRVIGLDYEGRWEDSSELRPIASEAKARNLAYVIYTSGSTGQPKGVEIQHDSLRNLVSWHVAEFGLTSADRASQFSGVGFDAAVWELWPYLSVGASVYIPDKDCTSNPKALRDWIVAQRITISFLPTAMAERVMALDWPSRPALRILLTGADTLRHYPSSRLPFKVFNNYGPTECTVVATSGVVSADVCPAPLPTIGRPISNTEIYILDENMNPVAVNAPGEIYIGGLGVGRGYRNRPDLTAQRFIQNPFSSDRGARVYKTGDLARYLPDGQISFIRRNDDQIKIRGYRIEPNEIVAALGEHPAIHESFVVARDFAPDDRRLVAYVVVSADTALKRETVRDFLAARLPQYMIPSTFVRVDMLPLTLNGKIDRDKLPDPDASNTLRDDSVVEPRSSLEQKLAEIVEPLLGVKQIGVGDNFFMLGGHSLLATQIISRLRESFGVEVPLRSLFNAPTIENLASEIEKLLSARSSEQQRNPVSELSPPTA